MKNYATGYVPETYERCDAKVAEGFNRFLEELVPSTPGDPGQRMLHKSYSLTSRRFSIWSKLREQLQGPFDEVIREHRGGPWAEKLLVGFDLATIGRTPPAFCTDEKALDHAEASRPRKFNLDRLVVPAKSLPSSKQRKGVMTADTVIQNLAAWEQNLRYVIRSLDWSLPNHSDQWQESRFRATVESVFVLVQFLPTFRPKKSSDPLNEQEGVHPQLPDDKTREQAGWHCELCWRPTMRAEAMSGIRGVPNMNARNRSARFCTEHDPRDPTSRYRADHRYRSAFLSESLWGIRSTLYVKLQPPLHPTQVEILKTAYRRVRARIRPATQSAEPSFRELVWELHQKGMPQAEIARKLDTSRQSVFRTLKKTKQLLLDHEEWRKLIPIKETYEAMSAPDKLAATVPHLDAGGFNPDEIAKIVDEPLATVMQILDR